MVDRLLLITVFVMVVVVFTVEVDFVLAIILVSLLSFSGRATLALLGASRCFP